MRRDLDLGVNDDRFEPFDGPAPNPVGVKIGHVEKGIAKLPQLR